MAITRMLAGRFAKIYIDSTNTIATKPASELTMARDGEWTGTPQMESTRVRADGRHNKQQSYGIDVSASFNLRVWAQSALDAGYVALRNACMTGDPVHMLLSDQDAATVGAECLEGWFEVSGFTRSFPLEGFVDVAITLVETSAMIDTARTPNAVFSVTAGGS